MEISEGRAGMLGDIRREIDAIDDTICALLEQRFEAVGRIRLAKQNSHSASGMPIRPAREAQILRRLLARPPSGVPAELKVRLWRAIITASTLVQSPVTVHVGPGLGASVPGMVMLRDYFGAFEVSPHATDGEALVQSAVTPGDIAVAGSAIDWSAIAVPLSVIATLPAARNEEAPAFFVIGGAVAEPSGADETLIVCRGDPVLPPGVECSWVLRAGAFTLLGLAGFLAADDEPLPDLARANPGLGIRLMGRYPAPLEVPK